MMFSSRYQGQTIKTTQGTGFQSLVSEQRFLQSFFNRETKVYGVYVLSQVSEAFLCLLMCVNEFVCVSWCMCSILSSSVVSILTLVVCIRGTVSRI